MQLRKKFPKLRIVMPMGGGRNARRIRKARAFDEDGWVHAKRGSPGSTRHEP